jgi:hypothetical protein
MSETIEDNYASYVIIIYNNGSNIWKFKVLFKSFKKDKPHDLKKNEYTFILLFHWIPYVTIS